MVSFRIPAIGAPALALVACAGLAACGGGDEARLATASARSGDMVVEGAWALPSLPPHTTCAGFLTVRNEGDAPDALVGVAVDAAGRAELHTMAVDEQQMMRMRQVERYPVPPGGSHALAPGGDHLMFYELTGPWLAGDELQLTLRFERAPQLQMRIPVRPRR